MSAADNIKCDTCGNHHHPMTECRDALRSLASAAGFEDPEKPLGKEKSDNPSDSAACSACGGCAMLSACDDDEVINTPCWKCNEHANLCGNCGHRGDIFDVPPLGDHIHCNHPVLEIRDSLPYNAGWGTLRDARETCEHWIPRQNVNMDETLLRKDTETESKS